MRNIASIHEIVVDIPEGEKPITTEMISDYGLFC